MPHTMRLKGDFTVYLDIVDPSQKNLGTLISVALYSISISPYSFLIPTLQLSFPRSQAQTQFIMTFF